MQADPLNTTTCPTCSTKLKVVESRLIEIGGVTVVSRRKRCPVHEGFIRTAELPLTIATDVLEGSA